jgi:hypothetical protein
MNLSEISTPIFAPRAIFDEVYVLFNQFTSRRRHPVRHDKFVADIDGCCGDGRGAPQNPGGT